MSSPQKIALVGHCGPDSSFLRIAVRKAAPEAQVLSADDDASLASLLDSGVDLLLFNRLLESGFADTEGVAYIKKVRQSHPDVRLMLVSNYPEAQAAAVAEGALFGFGKREIGSEKVTRLIREALAPAAQRA